jgi:tRNA1Val (adenine37-N6)-methyltransferase
MPRNHSFRFKQFAVQQERCAMKVCTDACVLGAWAEIGEAATQSTPLRLLDIGTGTGLLALMLAQRYPQLVIDAVELDGAAAEQARENVAASPFAERIRVQQEAIQDFRPEVLYDHIVTNPPFFQSDLRSPDAGVNRAHHAESLSLAELLVAVERLLRPEGTWQVLLPVAEGNLLGQLAAERGWVPTRQLLLTHQPGHRPFRQLTTYGRAAATYAPEELFIYENEGKTYSPDFRELLKDYYLVF